MQPTIHQLKTWPPSFVDVAECRMNFQIRRDDRGFKVGDHLVLREYDPDRQEHTGRQVERKITCIFDSAWLLAGEKKPVIATGFAVLGIVPVPFGQSLLVDERPDHVRAA